jgi:AcrR family transcriptional regulator
MQKKKEIPTEQLILGVAERLFLERGFALTSTTEIARQAGCNQALVHYYFRTKERLFEALFERKAELFFIPLLQPVDPQLSFAEKLRKRLEAHYDTLAENPLLPFLLFSEVTINPSRIEQIQRKLGSQPAELFRELEGDISREIAKGTIRPVSAIDLVLTMISLNVILFLAAPVLRSMTGMGSPGFKEMVESRKRENVVVILGSLRP